MLRELYGDTVFRERRPAGQGLRRGGRVAGSRSATTSPGAPPPRRSQAVADELLERTAATAKPGGSHEAASTGSRLASGRTSRSRWAAARAAGAGGPLPGPAHGVPARYDGVTRPKDALTIPVDKLRPDPDQPRREFDEDELARLAESLKARGQLQPIRVRWDEAGRVLGDRLGRAPLAGRRDGRAADAWRASRSRGSPTPDDDPGRPARRELPPVRPEADRAGPRLQGPDGPPGLSRPASSPRSLHLSPHERSTGPSRCSSSRVGPGAGGTAVFWPRRPPTRSAKLDDPALQAEVAGRRRRRGSEPLRDHGTRAGGEGKAAGTRASPRSRDVDLGDGITVTVRWRKSSASPQSSGIRKALKLVQDRERPDQAA